MNEEFQLYLAKWEDYLLVKVLLSKQLLDLATLKEIYQESHSTTNQDIRLGRLLLKKRLIKDMDYVKAMASVREYAKSLYENKDEQLQQEVLQIKQILMGGSQESQKTLILNPSYDEDNQDNVTALNNNVVQSQNNAGQTNVVQKDYDQDDSHQGQEQKQNEPSYPDKKFSSYEIIEEIARGGMGIVYKAKQLNLNRIVALKVLLTGGVATPTEIKRFRQEAEIAGSLQHPYIVSIYEVGEYNHYHYFTMDYIPGDTLKVHIKKHSRKKNLFKILVKISEALQYAHEHNVIHRDIKPSNIIVTPEWEPKLTDFGLAKRIDEKSDIPEEGHTLGTPFYLSPEQARGDKNIDGRTDIYSMGVILYEILTGQVPFRSNTLMELYNRIMNEDPVSPRRINKRIDKNISTICLKAMSKEPEERYQTAQELADDLSRYLKGEPIIARPPSQFKRIIQYIKKNSQKVIKNSITLLCLTILTIVAIWYFFYNDSKLLYEYDSYEQLEKIQVDLLRVKDNPKKDLENFKRFVGRFPKKVLKKESNLLDDEKDKIEKQYRIAWYTVYGLICLKFHQYEKAKEMYKHLQQYDEAYGYYGLGMVVVFEKVNSTNPTIKERATKDAVGYFDKAIEIAKKKNRNLWDASMQYCILKNNIESETENINFETAVQQKISILSSIPARIEQLESNSTISKEEKNEGINDIVALCNEMLWTYFDTDNNDDSIEKILLNRAKIYRIAKQYGRAVRDINFDEEIVISNVSSQNKNDIQKEKLTIENTIEKDEKIDSEAKKNFKKLINKNTSNKK